MRISVKVATCSGLKVATDRSVATRDIKLKKSGHFESSFLVKKRGIAVSQRVDPGLGFPSLTGFGVRSTSSFPASAPYNSRFGVTCHVVFLGLDAFPIPSRR